MLPTNLTMDKVRWIAALIAMITSAPSLSMPDDRNQIAQLHADHADLNQQSHRGEYNGNVQFDQGTTHLRATKAITKGNQHNKLILAIAFGDTKKQAHYWEQTAIDKPLLHAYANEIRYYPERHLIELLGNAHVAQGEDSFSAPKISFDTVEKHILAYGNAKQRTVIIIHPEKNHE